MESALHTIIMDEMAEAIELHKLLTTKNKEWEGTKTSLQLVNVLRILIQIRLFHCIPSQSSLLFILVEKNP